MIETIKSALNNYLNGSIKPFQLKTVFFDMDGVLFHSMPNHAIAWVQAFNEFGLALPVEEAYLNEGCPAFTTVKNLFRKYQKRELTDVEAEAVKKRKHAIMDKLPKSPVMSKMPILMEQLADSGIDRWVVTGSAQTLLIDRLENEYNGFLVRSKMITAHDVTVGKPEPEPYLMAMKKSGSGRSQAIVIENAPLGVISAKAAGLFTIAINTGPLDPKVLADAGADLVLSGSDELNALWPLLKQVLCNN